MNLAILIKRIAMKLGVDIRAYRPACSEAARLARLLSHHKIDTVLDVGANQGQYVRYLRSVGYCGKIICFEPLELAHEALRKLAKRDPEMIVFPRIALGERECVELINVAENSESSSFLTVSDIHLLAEPSVMCTGNESVRMSRLDLIAPEFLAGAEEIFLKIDVQGYELQVLRGAVDLLPKICGIQLELSLEPLYVGEPLYREVIDAVESAGFGLYDLNPCFSDEKTGRTYQFDAIFFRK